MHILTNFLQDNSKRGEYIRLGFVLFLGLVNGLVFTFLVPPWQHYDEPLHLEYVWLITDRLQLPKPGDIDLEMHRAAAASMLAHGFYEGMSIQPDFDSVEKPVWIGDAPQLANPPLYYIIASAPSILLDIDDVTRQLYAARFTSLFLYLLTIIAAWGVVSEFTERGHPIRLYLPMTLALLPGFADTMTAVNNDAAAVVFVSLTLWGSIHLVRNGFSPSVFLGTIFAVAASYYSKEVAIVSLPIFIIALLFTIFRNRLSWIPWAAVFVGAIAMVLLIFVMNDPAYWYRSTSQVEPIRQIDEHAPLGDYVFMLDASKDVTPRWMVPLFQPIPKRSISGLDSAKFSLGAWIWADTPATIRTPMIGDGYRYYYEQIEVTREPTYYAFNVEITDLSAKRLWVSLDPREGYTANELVVFYDGLVLTYDINNPSRIPDFDNANGRSGTWHGKRFNNLLRNGSAESAGIRLRSDFDNLTMKFLPARASLLLTSMLDPSGAGWIFKASGLRIFRTFWGKFGWGNVPLLGGKPYRVFGLLSMLAIIGFGIWIAHLILRKRIMRHANYFVILFSLFILIWFGAMTRGTLHLGVIQMYLPVARYAAPAIIPTLLILTIGWLEVLSIIIRWLRVPPDLREPVRFVVYLGAFAIFNLYSLYSVIIFYSRTAT